MADAGSATGRTESSISRTGSALWMVAQTARQRPAPDLEQEMGERACSSVLATQAMLQLALRADRHMFAVLSAG